LSEIRYIFIGISVQNYTKIRKLTVVFTRKKESKKERKKGRKEGRKEERKKDRHTERNEDLNHYHNI
jgi:hypothetical protein